MGVLEPSDQMGVLEPSDQMGVLGPSDQMGCANDNNNVDENCEEKRTRGEAEADEVQLDLVLISVTGHDAPPEDDGIMMCDEVTEDDKVVLLLESSETINQFNPYDPSLIYRPRGLENVSRQLCYYLSVVQCLGSLRVFALDTICCNNAARGVLRFTL